MADNLTPNERNPRKITPDKLNALRATLAKYGDLSGFVFNRRSQRLVGAHQRLAAFENKDKKIVREHSQKPDAQGTTAVGYVVVDGARYAFREVDWDEATEAAAMVVANQSAGQWDEALLRDLLLELEAADSEQFAMTGFDQKALDEMSARLEGASSGSSTFANFPTPNLDSTVAIRIGDYGGRISKEVYALFCAHVEEVRTASNGNLVMGDLIKSWLTKKT
jgi:hypothetical protein